MPEYLHPGVYVQEESSGAKPIEAASTSTACLVGETSRGRPGYPTFVTSWLQFERLFGSFDKERHLPLGVYHFFLNGGSRAYILRVLPKDAVAATVDLKLAAPAAATVSLSAAGAGMWANGIKVTVTQNQYNQQLTDWAITQVDADGNDEELELYSSVGGSETDEKFYATIINRDSNYVRIVPDKDKGTFPEWVIPAPAPAAAAAAAAAAAPTSLGSASLANGTDGAGAITAQDYSNALASLDRIDDVSILAIPGAPADTIAAGITYVDGLKRRDMIYIVDSIGSPRDSRNNDKQIEDVKTLLTSITNKSSYAALYFPWVEIADPLSKVSGATRFAPPSGMVAGLYARTDNTRGVWKAPAGTEATLLGTVGLAAQIADADQDAMNPIGINCIRQFPASGIVVWGARTLATQANPEYRYVPIRRTAMFLEKTLYRGTQWVVFEPNDEPLWSAIRFNINAFMLTQFRAGAFQGTKPADAFFVKCDADNNIQATIDAGQVHIIVAFAPLKPAEFVIIHIQQVRKD